MPWSNGMRAIVVTAIIATSAPALRAQPTVVDTNLSVGTVVSGLNQPTSMAFIGPDDFFVLEKATGQVKRVTGGVVSGVVLDLAVNSASERGLLGVAVSPDFDNDGSLYLYWSESNTGADTNILANTPLLGNRVDRFTWNGSTLSFAQNILQLRAIQDDPTNGQQQGNHNGGVIRFGPDGKLYVVIGDVGRRGNLQNILSPDWGDGATVALTADDQFGGPAPDNAHFTGAVIRLNPDGTAPADNPFYATGESIGGQAGANIQKLFAYGIRNSFGMAFDPVGGSLWMSESGDDSFDELNRVVPGANGGWVQIMGPIDRIAQYKDIEVNEFGGTLQQVRWPASNIADNPADALAAMFMLPGAVYNDPQLSWKYAVAPAAIGFLDGDGLGAAYADNLFVGAARTDLEDGYLFRLLLDGSRDALDLSDPDLADLVADNLAKFDATESESLLFGSGFGIVTDIHTGRDGFLYLVSLSNGAVYRIAAAPIPEPASGAVALIGVLALATRRRR